MRQRNGQDILEQNDLRGNLGEYSFENRILTLLKKDRITPLSHQRS
jgi:hypothetical protein